MKTVLQVEYKGDLAPYEFESAALAAAGAVLRSVVGTDATSVIEQARVADVIWLEWTPHFTEDVLQRLPRCGLVMRWGVGYDQIDVEAATALGIAVANAPSYCTEDVAEHAIALLLSVSRQIAARHEQMRAGEWRSSGPPLRRLQGSTVGVVGLGRIGRRVAELSSAFGARVVGADVLPVHAPGVQQMSLDQLLRESDFVSVHVPVGEHTRRMINRETLALMKPSAVLINTSRGGVIHQDALIEALRSGRLASAALDVYEEEPLPTTSSLRQVPNVVLTPHEASSSPESLVDLRREMCDATVEWLNTGWTSAIVNPQVRDRVRVHDGR